MDSRKFQLFKTEMCRNWQEMGECRYDKKCRFAHGQQELRCVQRHAKYKTEICRTFHLTGTCLYGVRCTFVHDEHAESSSPSSSSVASSTSSSPLFTAAPIFQNYPYAPQMEDVTTWRNTMFAKMDMSSIWSTSPIMDHRRLSSSSSSSSSSLFI